MNIVKWTGVLCIAGLSFAAVAATGGEIMLTEIDLSGGGWKLWHDAAARWEDDELFAPPVNLASIPERPPTGGWGVLETVDATAVSVPGTVEEYLQKMPGPDGDIKGVSWWWRSIRIPEASSPRRVLLKFDSVRQRAEVYLNCKLVGYDLVGNTPFEVDITDAANPGEECQLAVRITDPGGNFDWRDSSPFKWGEYMIPMSHGFGGITGRVKLVDREPVYVDDVYVQNLPDITSVKIIATVKNTTREEVRRNVEFTVTGSGGFLAAGLKRGDKDVAPPSLKHVKLAPGENQVEATISAPEAKVWDLEHPNLYACVVSLRGEGENFRPAAQQAFGFRWFAPEGIGKNAVFRLNGKRIVLRTAISWGFWPINGIFPTPELAAKEIRVAKELGQNMLNFHRSLGHPISFKKADELGLLIYEEPGGYVSGDKTEFSRQLSREKLLRMVRRDRSHPSLVIYNMINEAWDSGGAAENKERLEGHIRDMRDAHTLDPARTITHTSAWAREPEGPAKMHMRPFDDAVHMRGWYDFHHAGGPEVWKQDFYVKPGNHYGWSDDEQEIVYMGEEGALSSPPRLGLIKEELELGGGKDAVSPSQRQLGWDGAVYLEWYRAFDDFLTRKNLRAAFPTVDALASALGNLSMEHQSRKIENHRICNANDGYAVNGWEAEIVENHSGIVDCFRNPKGDPSIMARRNLPLYVAVKTRAQFAQIPDEVVADFYAINEKNLSGPQTLKIAVKDPAGRQVFFQEVPVTISGGETYGQLLAEGVAIPIAGATGMFRIEASLVSADGVETAQGFEEILALDWRSAKLGGKGAVWESGKRVAGFLRDQKQMDVPAFRDDLEKLDWIIVARPPGEGAATPIPAERLLDPSGKSAGLATTFFRGRDFKEALHQRVDRGVDLAVEDGAAPDPAVPVIENYSVRWEGRLESPASGVYTFTIRCSGGVRLTVNDQRVIDSMEERGSQTVRGQIELEAGKDVPIVVEYRQPKRGGQCKLTWAVPETGAPDPKRLLERVRRDGTTLLVLERAESWMDLIRENTPVKYGGVFKIGTAWLGGSHFVREHPLFKGLPVNQGMNWPYQAVVRDGRNRFGLILEGEDLVAGAWHCYPMQLGTAVGVIQCGKGRIIISTLDLCDNLGSSSAPAGVAKKLLCNFIEFVSARSADANE